MNPFPTPTLIDIVDIFLVATLFYLVFRFIRGTRGLYMLMGLLMLGTVFWLAQVFQLRAVGVILGQLFASLFLVVVVVFQHDIRRLLTKVGRSPFFTSESMQEREAIEEIVKTSVSLANKKIGALIVIEREASVVDHVEQGTAIDALVNKDLLTAIFLPVSPLHDGAVIIQGSRVALAGCLLPLSLNIDAAKEFGTRHRAAIGLTEETDSVVIVISEERGVVSIAAEGRITENLDAKKLRETLQDIFNPPKRLSLARKFIQEKTDFASRV